MVFSASSSAVSRRSASSRPNGSNAAGLDLSSPENSAVLDSSLDQRTPELFPDGATICNSYEVVRYLGVGSSGVVYQCRHKELNNHTVALKIFSSQTAHSSTEVERFKHELLAAYQVNHPNVVRGYELVTKNGFIGFTMEYVGGGSLADRLADSRKLPIKQTVDVLLAICSGLSAIHRAGIVHRDLKPANILLTAEGNIKIADFGIARFERIQAKGPKNLLGTVEYVSPEYVETGKTDARSDLYAMGVMAFEMMAGLVPFQGATPCKTLLLRLEGEAPAVSKYRRDCPQLLAHIIARALKKNPDERYQSADELRQDLEVLQDQLTKDTFVKPRREKKITLHGGKKDDAFVAEWKKRAINKRRRRSVYRRQRIAIHCFATTSFLFWLSTVALWWMSNSSTELWPNHGLERSKISSTANSSNPANHRHL